VNQRGGVDPELVVSDRPEKIHAGRRGGAATLSQTLAIEQSGC